MLQMDDRLPELLAALEGRVAASSPASATGQHSKAGDASPSFAAKLRKRRGTLLSRQAASRMPSQDDGLALSELLRAARQRLDMDMEICRTSTRSGRFSALCEDKLRDALSLAREVQRLDNAGKKGYEPGHASVQGGGDDAEERAGAKLAALQKDVESLKDAADLGDDARQFKTESEAIMCAHRHGMVLILSEHLVLIASTMDRIRVAGERRQKIVNRRRRVGAAAAQAGSAACTDEDTADRDTDVRDATQESQRQAGAQKMEVLKENSALHNDLIQLLETTRRTEQKVEEISQLNHLFTSTLLQQQAQIENVYNDVLEASRNIKGGNKELTKTIEYRRGSMRMIIILMVIVTLLVLALDRFL